MTQQTAPDRESLPVALLALAVLSAPLVWSPQTIEVYLLKGVLLGGLGSLAVLAALRCAQGRRMGWTALPLVVLIWAWHSVNHSSDPFRAEAAALALSGPVMVYLAAVFVGSARRIHRLLDLALIPGGLLALWLTLRHLELDGGWLAFGVESPLGHKNRLAAYLAICCPWVAYRGVTARDRVGFGWLALLGQLGVALAISGTRGAWLGALAGLGVTALLLSWRCRELRRRTILGGLSALALVALVVCGLPHARSVVSGQTERLVAGGHSVKVRQAIWGVTVSLAADRPLGYGAGQFPVVYPTVRLDEELKLSGVDSLPATPHCDPLQVAVELGWVILAVCLAWWLWLASGAFREHEEPAPVGAGLGMLVAATVHGSVSALLFSPGVSQLPALAAALLTLSASGAPQRGPWGQRVVGGLAVAVFAVLPWGRLMTADWRYEKARRTTDAREAIALASQGLESYPKHPPSLYLMGRLYRRVGEPEAAREALERFLETNPHSLGGLNNQALALLDLGRLDESRSLWQRIEAQSPSYQPASRNLARLAFLQRRFSEAIVRYEALLAQEPDQPTVHFRLGEALIEDRQPIRGVEQLKQAFERGYRPTAADRRRPLTGPLVRALYRKRQG